MVEDPGPWLAEFIEWDERNEPHATARLSASDIEHALDYAEVWAESKEGNDRWMTVSESKAGTPVTVVCAYDDRRRSLRPITAWKSTVAEQARFR